MRLAHHRARRARPRRVALMATLLAACAHTEPEATATLPATEVALEPPAHTVTAERRSPTPTCERPETFIPLCESPDVPWALELERALTAGAIAYDACLYDVLAIRALALEGHCAETPTIIEDAYGERLARGTLHRMGDAIPTLFALEVSLPPSPDAPVEDETFPMEMSAWVAGADPTAARNIARIAARVLEETAREPSPFDAIERHDLGLWGGSVLLLDLGDETMLCVDDINDRAPQACSVVAHAALRLSNGAPRVERETGSVLVTSDGTTTARLFVDADGDAHLLEVRIPVDRTPTATMRKVRGGYATDGNPWWWPVGRPGRLESPRTAPSRALRGDEIALAERWTTTFGDTSLAVTRFAGGALFLFGAKSEYAEGSYDTRGGFVLREGESVRWLTIETRHRSAIVVRAIRSLREETGGAIELGFTLTDTVAANAEGDTMRFEFYATLVPADAHTLRWGPDIQLAAEREEYGAWGGYTRTLRSCGSVCLALGQGTTWVGTVRYPEGRLDGVRARSARDDEEDRMRWYDEDPTPEEQREIDADNELRRLDALPRSVDLTALRGESNFP